METGTKSEIIVLGGGCFWCTEAVFKMMRGVISVLPGYTGGTTKNPTYKEICEGTTGHAEVVQIVYNPLIVTTENILTVFFGSHDPTTLNRQGADIGTQYRSAIFYTTETQKETAIAIIDEINKSSEKGDFLTTEVLPLETFYLAESYHQDYFAMNKEEPYCQLVINPKLEKVQKQFAALLKEHS